MNITPEMTAALAALRGFARKESGWAVRDAINVLDNAGIFAAIDEATGYDVDPEPEQVSKCSCPGGTWDGQQHLTGCPGDPSEWGDMAYTPKYPVRNDWDDAQDEQNRALDGRRNRRN